MVDTELPIVTEVRFAQSEKAESSIASTDSGIVIDVRLKQREKVPILI